MVDAEAAAHVCRHVDTTTAERLIGALSEVREISDEERAASARYVVERLGPGRTSPLALAGKLRRQVLGIKALRDAASDDEKGDAERLGNP